MGRFADALAVMKTNLQTPAFAGAGLKAVYVYPADYPFSITRLPTAVVFRMVNREDPIRTTSVGNEVQQWMMVIDILQQNAPLMNDAQIATADALYEPWLDRMRILLAGDRTLAGTALGIGMAGNVFVTPINTQLEWYKKTYWGIRFQLPVLQALPSSL